MGEWGWDGVLGNRERKEGVMGKGVAGRSVGEWGRVRA